MQTLLIVDDEPNIVEGLASQFEQRYGDSVIVLKSCSGRHALSVLQNNRVDVVLSDIRMPDLDGLELIEETEKLWSCTHFVFLSGFEDFDYIHRASKSAVYRGYLLKAEGDEVVMEKVDKELQLCAEELRAETQQGLQRAFLQRAALESALRGGGSWRDYLNQTSAPSLALDIERPVFMVLGKSPLHDVMDGMQSQQLISGILAAQAPRLSFEALLPEEGTLVWLLQEKEPAARPGAEKYIHALFEAIQQQMSDLYGYAVGLIVGSAGCFDAIVEQYGRLNNIWTLVARDTGRLIIVDESDYSDALFSRGGRALQEQFQFSAFIHRLGQQMRTGTPESVEALFGEYFNAKQEEKVQLHCERLKSESFLTLFTLLLTFLRENELGAPYDRTLTRLLDRTLRGENRTASQPFVKDLTALCSALCRQRMENEAHNTQAIISRINRYIEDHIEDYNLSLTELARVTGFNPSYLSRLYRMHTGRKLSEQIDAAKLRHAQELILAGAMVKNVAERTGFASPSAFILFFKRNTGKTPRQFFEEKTTAPMSATSKEAEKDRSK